jgi:transposase
VARFIGFDAHKSYAYVVELRDGERQEYRVAIPGGLADFKERLDPTAQLVLEASTNSFRLADELRPHVGKLVVADPAQTRGASSGAATTDRSSAEALARLLASDFVRPVWVPPQEIRSLRNLVELRVKLARFRVGSTNQLRALSRQELAPDKLGEEELKETIPQDATMQEFCSALFRLGGAFRSESDRLDAVFHEWCRSSKDARLLMSIPGVGPLVAACIVAQVGDIKRFDSPGKLCAYAGLVPRVHSSGQSHRTGGITKKGRRSLRWAMGLAAMSASRVDDSLKQFKEKLSERRPKAVAMTACARKLLVSVWHVWSRNTPYKGGEERHTLKLKRLDRKKRVAPKAADA